MTGGVTEKQSCVFPFKSFVDIFCPIVLKCVEANDNYYVCEDQVQGGRVFLIFDCLCEDLVCGGRVPMIFPTDPHMSF